MVRNVRKAKFIAKLKKTVELWYQFLVFPVLGVSIPGLAQYMLCFSTYVVFLFVHLKSYTYGMYVCIYVFIYIYINANVHVYYHACMCIYIYSEWVSQLVFHILGLP